ncbi:MAG: ArnT family glycosyltransferase [Patescibacteria group bacterium]|jgi:4-amino-4-deoxy-L-arabinose transferase-like glycosyltransferase
MTKIKSSIVSFASSNFLFIFLISFLVVSFFATRLTNLTIIPVFADEAIYIRWAQVMKAVPSLRFLPLSDGKQPLFMWTVIPFLKIFSDPLVAGRMVSVFSGFGTLIGVYTLSYLLFKNKMVSFFASLLYLISPFTLFFDRMALADGMLACWGIWSLVFGVGLVRFLRLDLAMILGISLGLGLLTKSPALIFALLLPSVLVLSKHKEINLSLLAKLAGLLVVVYLFSFAIYNILRLGPEFHMIGIRNKDYVFSLPEVLRHPFNPLVGNLKSVVVWYWILLTPLTFVSGIVGGTVALKKSTREAVLLWLWVLVPLLAQSAIAKVYTSRYILYTVPFFLIFAAHFIERVFNSVRSKVLVIGFLVLVFLAPVYGSLLLISDPDRAWLPENERSGYLQLWTAGQGIKQSSEYLREVAQSQKVLVGTEGFFGTLPDGLQIYLEGVPNVTVIGVGQPIKEISAKLTDGLVDNRVFLLVNDSRFKIKDTTNLRLIAKYPKAVSKDGHQENLLFFEILK